MFIPATYKIAFSFRFVFVLYGLLAHAEVDTPLETPFGAVYTDEHLGVAGNQNFTKANSYFFDITKVSGRAIVQIDAVKRGDDSNGKIFTVTDGKFTQIGAWTKQKIPKSGLRFDASKYITKPGRYELRFVYATGAWALQISKVSIDTRK